MPARTQVSPPVLDRIGRLRQRILSHDREICPERGIYMTESYRETEAKPVPIRRAMALDKILSNMTLDIHPDELIVGKVTSKVRGNPLCMEVRPIDDFYIDWDSPYFKTGSNALLPVPAGMRGQINAFKDYWNGKTLFEKWEQMLDPEHLALWNVMEWGNEVVVAGQYIGHESIGFDIVLEKGLAARIGDVDAEIKKLRIDSPDYFDRLNFLKACKIALGALIHYAGRYSAYAKALAEKESDPVRREELLEISRICAKVPAYPAGTFQEAVQACWITYCAVSIESFGIATGFLRPDQYLYPYYKKGIADGTLTDERAYELISMMLIKCNEPVDKNMNHSSDININLGGQTPDGRDAVNELTYLFLDAEDKIGLNSEDLIIKINRNNPMDYVIRACEVARNLKGKLKFVGDETMVNQMLFDARPIEYARDACVTGCTSPTVPGRSFDMPGGTTNMPLILDLALHDGWSVMEKRQMGPHTGDAREFTRYEQVWDALKAQCEYFFPILRMMNSIDKQLFAENMPNILQSALLHGCIEAGRDATQGGTYPNISFAINLAGTVNVGDSLAALKKLVFEENKVTMAQMMDAVDHNFAGEDRLLHLIGRAPKFGNNDDYVDCIVNDIFKMCNDIFSKGRPYAGAIPTVAASAVSANVDMGFYVGALPDGRKAGLPVAEGGLSPHQGRNVSGVTSTLLSVCKIDQMNLRHGSVLNIRIDPGAVSTPAKIEKLAHEIRAFTQAGGFIVQFNFISTETLKDAKRHPEKYRELVVRVATFAAYFVELQPDLQDDIISRMEFTEV